VSRSGRQRWQATGAAYLEARTQVRVRFQEVDALRVVWHGHYLTYLEEGRNAFGRQYGFEYTDILEAGYVAPLVHIELDYFAPARHDDLLEIRTRLHPADGARISFRYRIENAAGRKLATGGSEQVFTDLDGTLVLTRPAFVDDFLKRNASSLILP